MILRVLVVLCAVPLSGLVRTSAAQHAVRDRIDSVAERAAFHGEILVGDARAIRTDRGYGMPSGRVWRWASVTKQVIATLVLREAAEGRIELDAPVGRYLPRFRSANAASLTVRQLLRHQSGLPDPDATPPAADGVPAFYRADYRGDRSPLTGWCAGSVTGVPGGAWRYNNCDYLVAGALLESVTGRSWRALVASEIAQPLGLRSLSAVRSRTATVAGSVDGKPEGAFDLAAFGASAGLSGTAADLWRFDAALLTGRLLPDPWRAQLWDGQPDLGFIAIGQWVFTVPIAGCDAPVRIVERRGAIGGVEVRNLILPERDRIVVVFTDRGGFDFGEIWQGKGFSHDLIAAAACG